MPAALAEKPHCGACGLPFMNSTTGWAVSRCSMRARVSGERDMAGLREEAAILRRLTRPPLKRPLPDAVFRPAEAASADAQQALGHRQGQRGPVGVGQAG